MKATIDVKSRKDAAAIRRAMMDPEVYAFAVIMGTLVELPTDRARKRCLDFVMDQVEEQRESAKRENL